MWRPSLLTTATSSPPVYQMEFAELIKVSRLDNVRLRRPGQARCEVTLAVTGHHLIISLEEREEDDGQDREVWLLHRLLNTVTRDNDRSTAITLRQDNNKLIVEVASLARSK